MEADASLPLMGDNVILSHKLEIRIWNILVINIVASVLVCFSLSICCKFLFLQFFFPEKDGFQKQAKASSLKKKIRLFIAVKLLHTSLHMKHEQSSSKSWLRPSQVGSVSGKAVRDVNSLVKRTTFWYRIMSYNMSNSSCCVILLTWLSVICS